MSTLAQDIASQHSEFAKRVSSWKNNPQMVRQTAEFTFKNADKDGSGQLDRNEANELLVTLFVNSNTSPPGPKIIQDCWASMDTNKDNLVNLEEWTNFLFGMANAMQVPVGGGQPMQQQQQQQQPMQAQQGQVVQGQVVQGQPIQQQQQQMQQQPVMMQQQQPVQVIQVQRATIGSVQAMAGGAPRSQITNQMVQMGAMQHQQQQIMQTNQAMMGYQMRQMQQQQMGMMQVGFGGGFGGGHRGHHGGRHGGHYGGGAWAPGIWWARETWRAPWTLVGRGVVGRLSVLFFPMLQCNTALCMCIAS